MAKKYRLKINYSDITEENFSDVQKLRHYNFDGEVCTKGPEQFPEYYCFESLKQIRVCVPVKSWLTEIKEPLSFEEWTKTVAYEVRYGFMMVKKYDALDKVGDTIATVEAERRRGWNAALENQKFGEVDEGKDIDAFRKWHNRTVGVSPRLSDVEYSFRKSLWLCALKYARGLS